MAKIARANVLGAKVALVLNVLAVPQFLRLNAQLAKLAVTARVGNVRQLTKVLKIRFRQALALILIFARLEFAACPAWLMTHRRLPLMT